MLWRMNTLASWLSSDMLWVPFLHLSFICGPLQSSPKSFYERHLTVQGTNCSETVELIKGKIISFIFVCFLFNSLPGRMQYPWEQDSFLVFTTASPAPGIKACTRYASNLLPAYLRGIAGSVPDHSNKANIAIKSVTKIFGFSVHIKIMFTLYCILLSVH